MNSDRCLDRLPRDAEGSTKRKGSRRRYSSEPETSCCSSGRARKTTTTNNNNNNNQTFSMRRIKCLRSIHGACSAGRLENQSTILVITLKAFEAGAQHTWASSKSNRQWSTRSQRRRQDSASRPGVCHFGATPLVWFGIHLRRPVKRLARRAVSNHLRDEQFLNVLRDEYCTRLAKSIIFPGFFYILKIVES